METIKYPQSKDAMRSELDLFSSPLTDISCDACQYERIYSTSEVNEPYGKINFEFSGSGGNYIDLSSSYLYVKGKIVKSDGTALAADNRVGIANLFLHSLFADVQVKLNGKVVDDSGFTYPYMAYNKVLLGSGTGTKATELTQQLFYKDTKPGSIGSDNLGYTKRQNICKLSNSFELCGKIMLDIFDIKRYLPNGVDVQIIMTKASPDFFMWYTDPQAPAVAVRCKFFFEECIFVLRKISVNPSVVNKIESQLKKGSKCKYPLKRSLIRTYTIPQGSFQFQSDNLLGGRLPERLFVSFVDADAYTGAFDKNPYNYKHMNLETLTTLIEEKANYSNTLNVDFSAQKYLEGYKALFEFVREGQDGNDLTRDDFANNGFCIFASDVLCPTSLNAVLPQKTGQVKVFAKFRTALAGPTTVIIMSTFASLIEIDEKRNVNIVF
jgi:hypothetical protein